VEVRVEEPPTHIENDCVTDDLLVETETYPRCANGIFFEEVVESSQEMAIQCAFQNVTRWLNALSYQTSQDVSKVLREAFQIADMTFGEEEAVSWGDNFRIPPLIVRQHEKEFETCGFNLKKMVQRFKGKIMGNRLSVKSVESVLSIDNPEREKMKLLVKGMPLYPPQEFSPNSQGTLPSVSRIYGKVSSAVDRMIWEDFISKGLGVVLPKDTVTQHVKCFHLNKLSWTSKVGKEKGRPIVDCSAHRKEETPLNSEETKVACDSVWGVIQHPTIADMVHMILEFWEEVKLQHGVEWEDLVLWKMDLRGAYTLLSVKEEDVHLMAAEMSEEKIVFFFCGIFGWCGTPAAFQVATRAITFEVNKHISGKMKMYVDDMLGVSLKKKVEEDVRIASSICCRLFQSDCIEQSKTEIGRRVEVIGYVIDLTSKLVSVARKNYHRVIYGLSCVDLTGPVTVKTMQKLGSWISRYSEIVRELKPLARLIHQSYAGKFEFASFRLGPSVIRAVQIFRCVFLLAMLHEDRFTRSLQSFQKTEPQMIIEFDASLNGGGILWFEKCPDGSERCLGTAAVNFSSLKFGSDSSFQNATEFITAVLGLVVARRLVENLTCVDFRGDSKTALSWLKTKRFKTDIALNTTIILTWVCVKFNLVIGSVTHLPKEENTSADFLSREGIMKVCKRRIFESEMPQISILSARILLGSVTQTSI
jgi:hypothetical protein